jgi:hypothetical protein
MAKKKPLTRPFLKTSLPTAELIRLRELFRRNGYVRMQDPDRVETGGREYKKGDEVRLVADSRSELAEIRRLLKAAGFKLGRPFAKANQFRQPLYGRDQVARFVALMRRKK